ncbi:unnamed protein product [Parajaminaea phylloscopi]
MCEERSFHEVAFPRWPQLDRGNLDLVFAADGQCLGAGPCSSNEPAFTYDRKPFFIGYWGDDVAPPAGFEARNDPDRPLRGMCSGHTLGGQLYIELLWVDPVERRSGIGAKLLRRAEGVGIERCDAKGSYLNTFSFQGAEPFYLKQGYRRVMTIPGCFDGTVERIYLCKTPLSPLPAS